MDKRKLRFIDTNIFIRHFTKDDPIKSRACFDLFLKVQSQELEVTTSESVIAEIVYVLSSKQLYNLNRETIKSLLYPVLSLKGLKLANKNIYLQALDIYAIFPKLDFEDALTVAHMQKMKIKKLYSYDYGFEEIKSINRIGP